MVFEEPLKSTELHPPVQGCSRRGRLKAGPALRLPSPAGLSAQQAALPQGILSLGRPGELRL